MRARILAVSRPFRRTLRRVTCALVFAALPWGVAVAADDISYDVTFSGAPDRAIAGLVKRVSKLENGRRKGAANAVALDRRAARDVKRFLEVLHSEGYYDAIVDYRIDSSRIPATARRRMGCASRA